MHMTHRCSGYSKNKENSKTTIRIAFESFAITAAAPENLKSESVFEFKNHLESVEKTGKDTKSAVARISSAITYFAEIKLEIRKLKFYLAAGS
jgi:hypothetical protein